MNINYNALFEYFKFLRKKIVDFDVMTARVHVNESRIEKRQSRGQIWEKDR